MAMLRLAIIGVMGSGDKADEESVLAQQLGQLLVELNVHLLTGGGRGVMLAVCRAFVESECRQHGRTIGILPCQQDDPLCHPKPDYPNPFVEVVVQTHLPWSGERGEDPLSQNHINVLASRAIVALPGGLGTSCETRLAQRYQKPIIAFLSEHGAIPDLDPAIKVVKSISAVRNFLEAALTS